MIAADTSAWLDYSKDVASAHALRLERCLDEGSLVLPVPVLFELLSGPRLTGEAERFIRRLPALDATPGVWERAAALRRSLLSQKLKAGSIDCLIAQNCIDHDVPLIAADGDFRHFTARGLKLV
ncbi:MAG: PIN domain-containing protein [Elusimicrobia bacterium]|nr:PIN domain-containing protein [Elusimicrobiota bacterium]